MGSGSIIIACINTNRNYIGFEKDENYFKIAEDRISQRLKEEKRKLFGITLKKLYKIKNLLFKGDFF